MGIQTSEYSSPQEAVKNFPSSLLDKHNSRYKNQNAEESQQNKSALSCQEIAKTIRLTSINFLAS
jgi:murein tripeptide amidase MpaA